MELWELSREDLSRLLETVGQESDIAVHINAGLEEGDGDTARIVGDAEYFDTLEDLIVQEIADSHTDEDGQSTDTGLFLEDILMSLATRMPIEQEPQEA